MYMHRGSTTHDMFRNLGKVVYMSTLYNRGGVGAYMYTEADIVKVRGVEALVGYRSST